MKRRVSRNQTGKDPTKPQKAANHTGCHGGAKTCWRIRHIPTSEHQHTWNSSCRSMRSLRMTWSFCWQMQQICRHNTQRQNKGLVVGTCAVDQTAVESAQGVSNTQTQQWVVDLAQNTPQQLPAPCAHRPGVLLWPRCVLVRAGVGTCTHKQQPAGAGQKQQVRGPDCIHTRSWHRYCFIVLLAATTH